ncbi:MAG: oxidoreductase, partial [Candidatus Nanopelagicales bacterium]|nr:oxidoreductase [Candidatus Nanopelagicales bacterium]
MTDALRWTADDLPDLTGRTAVVTGANSGLGLATALELARHGADVTLAVRDHAKGTWAQGLIADQTGTAVSLGRLDLADLASVREFSDSWSASHTGGLDLLINNAGVMATPHRKTTDGFELQFGTNHLGHFALTGLLLPALVARPRSRVVSVSSMAHRMSGRLDLDYLMDGHRHKPWTSYSQSKLANLLFTAELQRRLDAAGVPMLALAAHPGYANTNLQSVAPAMSGKSMQAKFMSTGNKYFAQSAERGALPTLFAATAPGLPGDTYVGPDGLLEMRGFPRIVGRSAAARNAA